MTFPTIGALARNASPEAFQRLLAGELGAWTDNLPDAEDMARVLMRHVDKGLYSALPAKLVPYRATVDLFFQVAEEDRITLYIRAVALSLRAKRRPAAFRRALCGRTSEFKLRVPTHLYDDYSADRFTEPLKARFPLSVVAEIRMRAKAQDMSISEYIREAVYTRLQEEGDYD